ncbi:MAG: preprotein translocase subunit SecY [Alphaproteobacteria bacterium]|nr:preprotein translocase subunit SecY [Alphaproteobacteria bacterium]
MTSSAERLAANMNLGAFGKADELKKRLWFVIGALIVYRIGTYIPLPGIDPNMLAEIFRQQGGGILGVFNMFSGGALGRMSIFALAVVPYISASIIMQLMTVVSPQMAAMKKEGEAGKQKINQYTRYGTVVLAALQGWGIGVGLENMTAGGDSAVLMPGFLFRFTTALTLVGGTMFLMWLGEQITSRGIGNGISLIIFAGIVAEFPGALYQMLAGARSGSGMSIELVLIVIAIAVGLVLFIVFMERAQRRLVVQYPKRQVGNKLYQGEKSHLPLKLNMAGVIPPIFASSILMFPLTIASFNSGESSGWLQWITSYISHGQPLYVALYIAIIIFFSFFYTAVVFPPKDAADNLKKNGGFIAGIRPGKNTENYIDYVLTRLTTVGALYIAFVCAVPELLISNYNVPFYLGGTSLLIVVNVTMDFVSQVQSHLFAHQYEGLLKKSKLRGRRA